MRQRWKPWVRTFHVYLSLLGLILILFFSLTGFILNHSDWFGLDETTTETRRASLPPELLVGAFDRLTVVESLRRDHGVAGLLEDFETGKHTLRISFARPGELTDVLVDRRDGSAELRVESGGAAQLLTDLHRGEHSGAGGGLLIDATSVLLLLISLTGLVLWVTLPKRRRHGVAAGALGVGFFVCICVYCLL